MENVYLLYWKTDMGPYVVGAFTSEKKARESLGPEARWNGTSGVLKYQKYVIEERELDPQLLP